VTKQHLFTTHTCSTFNVHPSTCRSRGISDPTNF
jgi:hypothetical protein